MDVLVPFVTAAHVVLLSAEPRASFLALIHRDPFLGRALHLWLGADLGALLDGLGARAFGLGILMSVTAAGGDEGERGDGRGETAGEKASKSNRSQGHHSMYGHRARPSQKARGGSRF